MIITHSMWIGTTSLISLLLANTITANPVKPDPSPVLSNAKQVQFELPLHLQHTDNELEDGDGEEDLFVGALNEIEDYEGYEVWRIDLPRSGGFERERVDAKEIVMETARFLDLDVWHASSTHIDLLLPPSHRTHFFHSLPPQLHPATPLIASHRLQTLLTAPKNLTKRPSRKRPLPNQPPIPQPPIDPFNLTTLLTPFHDRYHSGENHTAFGEELVRTFPGLVRRFVMGLSAEGREVWGLRLSKAAEEREVAEVAEVREETGGRTVQGRNLGGKKRVFYIQGGQHAREWISPATLLYLSHHLLYQASIANQDILHLLETFEFVIVPTINPDGYEYSRDHSRLWRKNRQDVGFRNCKGIDMNSNWGYQWTPSYHNPLTTNAPNPCSESYSGAEAFEAVETKLVADFLQSLREGDSQEADSEGGADVRVFVDIHSYGQLFMFPYAYSCSDFPGDAETLMEAGLGVAKAVRNVHGTIYQSGQACDLVYRMSGDSIDYAYGAAGIRWSYSVELRDTGTFGFLLPPSSIRDTAAEMTEGLVYLAKFVNVAEGVVKT